MEKYIDKFPEFKKTKDPSEINFDECVVWRENDYFVYIESEDIRYVSWSFGIVSIIPSSDSILSKYFNAIIINSNIVFVGKNIKTGN
jgi:hypothetical protein